MNENEIINNEIAKVIGDTVFKLREIKKCHPEELCNMNNNTIMKIFIERFSSIVYDES